jgi:hypothetical protein
MAKLQKINLDELPEFVALDPKRQAIARGIAQGVSYSRAVKSVGLNATREKRNPDLQRVLWILKMGVDPEGQPATAAGQLDVYECARRLGWLLGDDTQEPSRDVEHVMWILDEDDWMHTEIGVPRQITSRPDRLTDDQIARYHTRMEEVYPKDRQPCSFCGVMVFHGRRVCDSCLPKCRCGQASCPASQCRENAQPVPAAYVQPSRPVVDVPTLRVSKCQRCGRTTPGGVLLCDACSGIVW